MKTLAVGAISGVVILVSLSLHGCGGDGDPGDPVDTTAPAAVADLHVQTAVGSVLTLGWTAPGDDGSTGTATSYDIRYSPAMITEATWAACMQAAGEPAPAVAGAAQSTTFDVAGKADCYVAMKTADEASNWSGLSNVVSASVDVPIQVRQLTTEGSNVHPCVNDGVVCWVRQGGAGDEIYVANVLVASPAETRLTDDGGEKAFPSSHGSAKIVWQRRAGGLDDWELYSYDHLAIPRYSAFTDNEIDDRYPVLAGGGDFAWLQGATMFEEVHYWNESGHGESVISDTCCPSTGFSNDPPTADDGTVVWRSYDRIGTDGHRTYLWDGALADLSVDVDAALSRNYSLHAGDLAYEWGASPVQIRLWDGAAVQTIAVGYSPALYDGTIAFEVWDGHDWEIRFWDGSEILEITDNDYNDTQVSLFAGVIAWVGRPTGGSDQIFYARVGGR